MGENCVFKCDFLVICYFELCVLVGWLVFFSCKVFNFFFLLFGVFCLENLILNGVVRNKMVY